jgi:hypothetical protein
MRFQVKLTLFSPAVVFAPLASVYLRLSATVANSMAHYFTS